MGWWRGPLGCPRLAFGISGAGAGATTLLLTRPMPSASRVTTSPGTSGFGTCSPARPQTSARQPRWHVPEASRSPGVTFTPREAKLIGSSKVNAQLALGALDVPRRPVVEDRVADDSGGGLFRGEVPAVLPVDDADLKLKVELLRAREPLDIVERADARVRVGEVEARRVVPLRGHRVVRALLRLADVLDVRLEGDRVADRRRVQRRAPTPSAGPPRSPAWSAARSRAARTTGRSPSTSRSGRRCRTSPWPPCACAPRSSAGWACRRRFPSRSFSSSRFR
jgi:hypothetical protein